MSDPGGIPELKYAHPDGRLRTRLEMEQWLRQEVPKVHWLRIIASRVFGLTKQISWDMKEIVLKHWLLDEMVRRQAIVGDQLGVNANASNDEGEVRQFTQRLAALIQSGQAVQPQHAEGIDMSGYQPPPPPMIGGPVPPNGQQQMAYPPGPPQPPQPQGPPQGYAHPPGPPQQPQYQQPPMAPPGPPGPSMAPPGYGPPPGPPMGPPPGVPQVPQQTGGGRRGRKPADQAAQPAGPPAPPQGFAPPPFPAGPQAPVAAPQMPPPGFAPAPTVQLPPQQFQVPAPGAASVDPGINQKLEQLLSLVSQQATKQAALEKKYEMMSMMLTIIGRAMYHKQGSPDIVGFLNELQIPLPQ